MENVVLIVQANSNASAVTEVNNFFYDLKEGGDNSIYTEYHTIGGYHGGSLYPVVKTFKTMVIDKLAPEKASKAYVDFYISQDILEKYKEWLNVTWEGLGGEGDHYYTNFKDGKYPLYSVRPLKECADIILSDWYKDPLERAEVIERKALEKYHEDRIENGELPLWHTIGHEKIRAGKLLAGVFSYGESFFNIYAQSYLWPSGTLDGWWAVEVEYE